MINRINFLQIRNNKSLPVMKLFKCFYCKAADLGIVRFPPAVTQTGTTNCSAATKVLRAEPTETPPAQTWVITTTRETSLLPRKVMFWAQLNSTWYYRKSPNSHLFFHINQSSFKVFDGSFSDSTMLIYYDSRQAGRQENLCIDSKKRAKKGNTHQGKKQLHLKLLKV